MKDSLTQAFCQVLEPDGAPVQPEVVLPLVEQFVAKIRAEMARINALGLPEPLASFTMIHEKDEPVRADDHMLALFGEECLRLIAAFRSDLQPLVEGYLDILEKGGAKLGNHSDSPASVEESSYDWTPHLDVLQDSHWEETTTVLENMRNILGREFKTDIFGNAFLSITNLRVRLLTRTLSQTSP